LHDESAVAVRFLGQRVELGNGIVEGLLGKVASTVWRIQDLVVEDREVEGQAEADGVGWGQLGLSNIGGVLGSINGDVDGVCSISTYLVGLVGGSGSNLALLAGSKLSQVAVVVTLPKMEDQQTAQNSLVGGQKRAIQARTYIL
jgi:hypothetical protein